MPSGCVCEDEPITALKADVDGGGEQMSIGSPLSVHEDIPAPGGGALERIFEGGSGARGAR